MESEEETMNRSQVNVVIGLCVLVLLLPLFVAHGKSAVKKPSPKEVIGLLKEGNDRFVQGKSLHPHTNRERLKQAGVEDQGDHAFATVITCSDSRVPVERIFDAGVMDIFVVRVAGNVCNVDEAGSIEYGLCHVNTPLLVVLGHTQCGAVKAVTQAVQGQKLSLERNIPPLVAPIGPAVKRAITAHPEAKGKEVIPYAIEENVWQGIEDLFMKSPAVRDLVKSGKAEVVGAIYDVSTGEVKWLPETKVTEILKRVEASPDKAVNAMAQ
jgi:carbonic anhydrase